MTTPFLSSLPADGPARDDFLRAAIAADAIDPPTWVEVTMGRVVLRVTADYLTIRGEHVPMSAPVAQAAADRFGALLPTPAMVDAIEGQAGALVPMPTWSPPPGHGRGAQTSGAVYAWCEEETRRRFEARGVRPGQLVAGHRKDVVIAARMLPGHVTIYGGRWPNGSRIQTVSAVHESEYDDYSSGTRLIDIDCTVDGKPATVSALLSDLETAPLLGGPVAMLRYPTPATTAPTDRPGAPDGRPTEPPATLPEGAPPTLRVGASGPWVIELQRRLTAKLYSVRQDGVFGPQTLAAVRDFQEEQGLVMDGVVGRATWRALGSSQGVSAPAQGRTALAFGDMPPVLSDLQVEATFGPLRWELAPRANEPGAIRILNDWQAKNLRKVTIPQLRGVLGAPPDGGIYVHRLIVEQTRAMFAAWEKDGDAPLLLAWAGTWNPRVVRGFETSPHPLLSRHSYATAMDINAPWNPFHGPAAPLGAKGSNFQLLFRAREFGFTSLGEHDPMHFEAVAVL